jgi:hypothetical protein
MVRYTYQKDARSANPSLQKNHFFTKKTNFLGLAKQGLKNIENTSFQAYHQREANVRRLFCAKLYRLTLQVL